MFVSIHLININFAKCSCGGGDKKKLTVKLPDVKAADFQVKPTQIQYYTVLFHIIKLSIIIFAEQHGRDARPDAAAGRRQMVCFCCTIPFSIVWLIIFQVQIPHSGTSTRRPPGSMRTRIRCPGGCQSSSI